MSTIYLDGQFLDDADASVPATSHGVLFGRGVYETFRARQGSVFLLERHEERLGAGAALLGMDLPEDISRLAEIVCKLTERCGLPDARVRLTLTAGPEGSPPHLLIQARAATDYPEALYERGMTAVVSDIRRNETSPLSRIKSLSMLDGMISRERALAQGADTAILLNTRGTVAEASTANVFVVRDGSVLTPPIEDGALPGVTRSFLLDGDTRESSLTLDDLLTADEAFLTGSVMGVMPLVRVDGKAIGQDIPGPATLAARTRYEAAVTSAGESGRDATAPSGRRR
jgi:branched-chain amino acid aminotransferase